MASALREMVTTCPALPWQKVVTDSIRMRCQAATDDGRRRIGKLGHRRRARPDRAPSKAVFLQINQALATQIGSQDVLS